MYFNKKKSLIAMVVILAVIAGLLFYHNQSASYHELGFERQFRFVVLGDSRGDNTTPINEKRFRALMENISQLSNKPSFILFTGDMVSGGGNIKEKLELWKTVADQYYPIKRIYPAIGNHDGDEKTFSNAFKHLPREQLKGYLRTAYYFDYGNSRFIVLNSIRNDSSGGYVVDEQQLAWLERLLKNSRKTHHFVMFHVPAYPMGAHYGNSLDRNPTQRDALWSILDKHHVTAVFVAHEHNYNRRIIDHSFNTKTAQYRYGIYQLTLGGAGAPLSGRSEDNKNIVAGPFKKYHYMTVDVIGGLAVFNVYDINNNVIDTFEVARGKR